MLSHDEIQSLCIHVEVPYCMSVIIFQMNIGISLIGSCNLMVTKSGISGVNCVFEYFKNGKLEFMIKRFAILFMF